MRNFASCIVQPDHATQSQNHTMIDSLGKNWKFRLIRMTLQLSSTFDLIKFLGILTLLRNVICDNCLSLLSLVVVLHFFLQTSSGRIRELFYGLGRCSKVHRLRRSQIFSTVCIIFSKIKNYCILLYTLIDCIYVCCYFIYIFEVMQRKKSNKKKAKTHTNIPETLIFQTKAVCFNNTTNSDYK